MKFNRNTKLIIYYSVNLLIFIFFKSVEAQVLLSSSSPSNTQNFDGMGTGTTLPTNWKIHQSTSPTYTGGTSALGAQASSGTPTAGNSYNWGTSSTERAAGVMTSGSYSSPNSLMSYYRNNDGSSSITSISVSYDLERYRVNSASASVSFFYSTNGSTWTAVTAGDIAAADLPTGASAYFWSPSGTPSSTNGGVISKSGITISLTVAPGGDFYLRWNLNTTGTNSQGIGIDNVVVTCTFSGGPSISLGTHSGAPYSLANCSSTGSGTLAYTISGTFNSGNVFTAELSDASGSFANPLAIGSLATTAAGTINLTIPAGIPTGSGYRLRITSTDPVVTSSSSSTFSITQGGSYCPWIDDYRTNGSNTWITVGIWQQYTYNPTTKSLNWSAASTYPNSSTSDVFIRNGHTVTLSTSLNSVKDLIVETGGKLYRNHTSSLTYLNLNGDILCNGTIGNGTTDDALGFNIQAGNHTISGSGTFDAFRIRNSDQPGGGNSNLTIDMNINLRWTQTIGGGTSGTNAIYNDRNTSCVFNVTINAGKTLNITNTTGDGGIGWDGAGTGTYPGTDRGGTMTIYGTVLANGPLWLGSNNSSNKPAVVIENGGLLKVNYIDFGSDNVASGAGLTIKTGGKLELSGASSGSTWLNTSAGSVVFTIQTNSTVEYSGATAQTIYHGFNYKKLIVNGSGVKTLTGNVTVDEELTLTSGVVSTGTNRLFLNSSSASSLVGGSSSSFINGNFRRAIATNTSTYEFPVGDGTASTNFKRLALLNNNLTGVSYIDGYVNSITETGDNIQSRLDTIGKCWEDGDGGLLQTPLSQLLNTGQWDLTPNASPTGGSYGLRLYFANVSGLSTADNNRFAIVKRPSSSTDYADWDAFASSTTLPPINAAGRTFASGYAQKNGFTSFSKFAIAKAKIFTTPLPVELASFTVQKHQSKTKLTWITLSEKNNDYFVIERSKDSKSFEEVGRIYGKGTTNELNEYLFFDNKPLPGVNYYRLKQVDYDGQFNYSAIKNVTFNSNDLAGINAYHHHNWVTLNIPEALTNAEVRVISPEGRIIYKNTFEELKTLLDIPAQDWSMGIYLVYIISDSQLFSTKLIVQ